MNIMISKDFLKGCAKVLDISGITKELPNLSRDREKDYLALRGDWENVGNEIRRGIRSFK